MGLTVADRGVRVGVFVDAGNHAVFFWEIDIRPKSGVGDDSGMDDDSEHYGSSNSRLQTRQMKRTHKKTNTCRWY